MFSVEQSASMQLQLMAMSPDSCYTLSNLEYRQLPNSNEGIACATLVLQGHRIVTQESSSGETKVLAIPVVKRANFRLHINSEGRIVQSKAFHYENTYS